MKQKWKTNKDIKVKKNSADIKREKKKENSKYADKIPRYNKRSFF